jgi:DNA-binding beta-propeller fold protein YncE
MNRYVRPSLYLTLMLVFAGRAAAVPAVTTTVAIGPRPVAVAVERNTHRVYVADVELGAVVEYDGARGALAGPINIGGQPSSLAFDNVGHRLFVGNRDVVGPAVSVVDTATGRAQSFLPAGHRVRGLAFDEGISPAGRLYVGDPDGSDLMLVDGGSGQVTGQVPLGGPPVAIAVNPQDGEVAVAVQGPAAALMLFDANNQNMNAVPVPITDGQPVQVAVDSTTGKFFVARGGANPALLVLRPSSTTFDNAIPTAPDVTGLAIDPRTSRIYLSHGAPDLATVIDGASGNPVALLPIGDVPNHAAVDIDSTPTRVYMVDTASGVLSILTDQ